MNAKKYKYILIDIDDTLLDFQGYVKEGLRSGFEKYGLGIYTEDTYRIFTEINTDLWHRLEKGQLDFDKLIQIRFNLIFERLGIDFDGPEFEKYFRAQLNESAIPVEGAGELMTELSSRYVICVASNGPSFQQRHRIELAGMDKYISYYFISEEIGVSKPAAEFFDAAFDLIRENDPDVNPDECLFIGDSLSSDISGGRSYGLDTVLFDRDHRYDKNSIDKARRPDLIINSLKEIHNILLG